MDKTCHKKNQNSLSGFEIALYFSQKKQETDGTTLYLSLLLKWSQANMGKKEREQALFHFKY